MKVQVENLRRGPQFTGDKAELTFDVRAGESYYIDIRLLKNKNGHNYIAYPNKKRENGFGEQVFVRLYDWGKDRNDEFGKAVLEALKVHL